MKRNSRQLLLTRQWPPGCAFLFLLPLLLQPAFGLMVVLAARLAVWSLPEEKRPAAELRVVRSFTQCLVRLLKWQPALAPTLAAALVPILPRAPSTPPAFAPPPQSSTGI
jgi:hypothetical protein